MTFDPKERADIFLRQNGIAPPAKLDKPITIVGCGAVGTHVGMALMKMGCSQIYVWDHDVVSEHNWPNQLFPMDKSVIGRPKVEVFREAAIYMTGVEPVVFKSKLLPEAELDGIVISGVDSMKARREIWEKQIKMNPLISRYVDCRMGGRFGQLFQLNPMDANDIEMYEKRLPSDEDTSELPCTERSIVFTQFGMASMVASIVQQELCEDEVVLPLETIFDFRNGYVGTMTLFGDHMVEISKDITT